VGIFSRSQAKASGRKLPQAAVDPAEAASAAASASAAATASGDFEQHEGSDSDDGGEQQSQEQTQRRGPKFGVSRQVYYGRHSEGNRFILNTDL